MSRPWDEDELAWARECLAAGDLPNFIAESAGRDVLDVKVALGLISEDEAEIKRARRARTRRSAALAAERATGSRPPPEPRLGLLRLSQVAKRWESGDVRASIARRAGVEIPEAEAFLREHGLLEAKEWPA